jgi:glycosyltransferase involved in cell wall biosynthesis
MTLPVVPPPPTSQTVLARESGQAHPDNLVTVAVSLFNYAHFILPCLASVAAQLHPALELIVVDDASDADDSLGVAEAWMGANADRFARTLLLRHARNQGLAQTRNTAFAHATGECVFVLDADNTLYPRAIGRLHAVLSSENFDAAYTQLEFFGERRRIGHADLFRRENLVHGNYVDAMALVRKRAWSEVGGYTHLDGGWEDYDFWCKFIEHGLTAAYVPEILCRYRVHKTSMLRTETTANDADLRTTLSLRHPWLRL